MSDDRPYPPTEAKLKQLRLSGLFPHNNTFTGIFVLGFFLLGFIIFVPNSVGLTSLAKYFHEEANVQSLFSESLWVALKWSASFISFVLIGIVASGLWQSRFLVAPGLFGATNNARRSRRSSRHGLSEIFPYLAVFASWLVAGAVIIHVSMQSLAPDYAEQSARMEQKLFSPAAATTDTPKSVESKQSIIDDAFWVILSDEVLRYRNACVVIFSLMLVLGIGGRIRAVVLFQKRHKMSRRELEAEYRETEPSADVRQARSEARNFD